MSPRDWQGPHEALAATVERLIASHAEGKEEDHRGPGPVVVPASAVRVVEIDPAAPGVSAAEGGLAAAPRAAHGRGTAGHPPCHYKSEFVQRATDPTSTPPGGEVGRCLHA